MNSNFLIDFIIPQYRDPRILRAISSIKNHPSAKQFRIIVQDGGRDFDLQASIRSALRPSDLHVIEPDHGIFDALNKALGIVSAPWIGWIGSDDLLAPEFNPETLVQAPSHFAFVSCTTLFFKEGQPIATRVYQPIVSSTFRRWGAHVPHFSTFLRTDMLSHYRFDEQLSPFSDIFFFLVIEQSHNGFISNSIATYMAEGGASNDSRMGILRNNLKIYREMTKKQNFMKAFIFVIVKLIYKIYQRVYAKISTPYPEYHSVMKIAIVLPFFHVGGVERWAMHARNALIQDGHQVTILSLGKITADAAMFAGGPPPLKLGIYGLIRLFVGPGRPDLLISALTKSNVLLGLAGRFVGISVVGSVHLTIMRQPFESILKYRIRLLLHKLICKSCSAVIAVSEGVRNELIDICPQQAKKITRIYNPCFTENEIYTRLENTSAFNGKVMFAAAGRLHIQKGFDDLIDAFSQMPTEARKYATLTIFGEGPDKAALSKKITELGLIDQIILAGNVESLPIRLRKFDAFVLSSRYEGFGNVLAEAMAAGCDCIAFDVPHGPREILCDGKFGTLVPAGDCMALSKEMAKIVNVVRFGKFSSNKDIARQNHLRLFTPVAFSDAFRLLIHKNER